MAAGYSGTPLLQKLGIKPAMKVKLISEPADYYTLLNADISQQLCKPGETPDLVHLFVTGAASLEREMKKLEAVYQKNPALQIWVSWYKKSFLQSQGKPTGELTEDTIRNYALQNGLVDVKVCAVSNAWSGLKLVVPLAKR